MNDNTPDTDTDTDTDTDNANGSVSEGMALTDSLDAAPSDKNAEADIFRRLPFFAVLTAATLPGARLMSGPKL